MGDSEYFRRKRSDTKIGNIERTHKIDLKVRGDMRLGTLLQKRGFDTQSQFLQAYRGNLTEPARKRRLFLSFHAEDKAQVNHFRRLADFENVDVDFYDGSLTAAINSEDGSYIRSRIRPMIQRASVLVCLIGNGTAWRDWVDWEIRTAYELGKGVCGVRLRESYGRNPPLLKEMGTPIAQWNTKEIIAAIECAAARRS